MDENTLEYRQKHKKCKYCEYYEATALPIPYSPIIRECVLKDKQIKYIGLPRFCRWYQVKNNERTAKC